MVNNHPEYTNYQGWEEVPEELIVHAAETAEHMGGPALIDNSNFKRILKAGSIYKEAGLTPIYVWEEATHRLAVYPAELQNYRYH